MNALPRHDADPRVVRAAPGAVTAVADPGLGRGRDATAAPGSDKEGLGLGENSTRGAAVGSHCKDTGT
jgi:hypothetical protein